MVAHARRIGRVAAAAATLGAAVLLACAACSGTGSTIGGDGGAGGSSGGSGSGGGSGGGSGSSSGAFPYSGPSCSASQITPACWSCIETQCNGGCITTACGSFFACYCACPAGDTQCQNGCAQTQVTGACRTCIQSISSCSSPACQSQCSSTGSSGGSGSGGTVSAASCESSDGSICYMVTTTANYTCPSSTARVGSCPKSNEVGSCVVTSGAYNVTEYYYCAGAGANVPASSWQMACTNANGSWTAGYAACGSGSSSGANDAGSGG